MKKLLVLICLSFYLSLNCSKNNLTNEIEVPIPILTGISDTSIFINDTLSLFIPVHDSFDQIYEYIWQINGQVYDTTVEAFIKVIFGKKDTGQNIITTQAFYDQNIISNIDTTLINVLLGAPSFSIVSTDTVISTNCLMEIKMSAFDPNGTIDYYSITDNGSFSNVTPDSVFKFIWTHGTEGIKKLYIKAVDDDQLESNIDSININVISDIPTILLPGDTILSFYDTLLIKCRATDTFGGFIEKYLWSTDNISYDTTSDSTYSLYMIDSSNFHHSLHVKVIDNDGNISKTDSINVIFNKTPYNIQVNTNFNTDVGGWQDYDFSSSTGSVQVSFSAQDINTPFDTLVYSLKIGKDLESLALAYTGKGTSFTIPNICIQTKYYIQVTAEDLDGESISIIDSIFLTSVPPKGTFWNLVTDSALIMNNASSGSHLPFYKHNNKMWIITNNQKYSDTIQTHNVYNSIDGKNWNLVSNKASFKHNSGYIIKGFSFNEKMWVITYKKHWFSVMHEFYVYNSDDGITWNLVTDYASFSSCKAGNYVGATSYQNKMWVVTHSYYPSTALRKHYVYNSSDGITWDLVTHGAYFSNGYSNTSSNSSVSPHGLVTHNNKMWVISHYWDDNHDAQKHFLYNSSNGITWNMISDNARFNGNSDYIGALSYNNKVWILTYNKSIGNNVHAYNVYNSEL